MALRLLAHRREPVILAEALPGREIILFDPRMERSHQPVLNRLRGTDFSPGEADLLIVRGSHVEFLHDIDEELAVREFVGDLPVLALAGSHDPVNRTPILYRPSWARPYSDAPDLTVLRAGEVEGLLRRSTAIWRHDGCHYDLPSAAVHAAEFIRLADALHDHIDLVRLADWLLPFVGSRTAVVADTGSLLALLLCIRDEARSRFRDAPDGTRPQHWTVPVDALDAYPRRAESVQELVDNLRVADWEDMLFVISVTSTGEVERRVRDQAPDARIAVICDTRESPSAPNAVDPDVFFRHPVDRWALNADEQCRQCGDLHLLHVHPETYEITARLDWTPLGFLNSRINSDKWFWEAVDRADAVRLHEDWALTEGSRESVRHLAVALDIEKLLADEIFRSHCLSTLQTLVEPDLVLIPRHAASGPLRALANERWLGVAVLDVGLSINDEASEAIGRASSVLILDDVCITGHTLSALRIAVYDVAQAAGRPITPQGFVVVSRTATDQLWRWVRTPWMRPTATGMDQGLLCGAHVPLPPPGDTHCPWCRERKLLQRLLPGLAAGPAGVARARIDHLRATPLRAPVTLAGVAAEERTEDSIFGPLRPAAAVAASTSHAQCLREAIAQERDASTIRYFNIELFLPAIFDAVLVAGTVRTLDARHVREPARQMQVAEALRSRSHFPSVIMELAVAAAEGKLPADAVLSCIESHIGDVHLQELARALARRDDVARAISGKPTITDADTNPLSAS